MSMDIDRNTPHRDVVDAHPPEVTRPSQEKVKDRILPARLSHWKLEKSPAGPKEYFEEYTVSRMPLKEKGG